MESGKVRLQQGNSCSVRYAPCSTFKIALSLMGYDSRILHNAHSPRYPFKQGYQTLLPEWRQAHMPASWMSYSVLWYSQEITKRLGSLRLKQYVDLLEYGNRDISGDLGKDNGLLRAWLSSSLKISPEEQAIFIKKLLMKALPVSAQSQEMNRQILFSEVLPTHWKLYGKTGMGYPEKKKRYP
jgi:beta-lactamase class D